FDFTLDPDVAASREGARSCLGDLAYGFLCRFPVEIDAGNLRASFGERERDRAADPGARAGHHRILAPQRKRLVRHRTASRAAARPRYASRTRSSLASSVQGPLTMIAPVCNT